MVVVIGALFAITTMLCWGTADFFAKKAVDKVGYVPALMINQAIALGPIFIFTVLSSHVPVFSLNLIWLVPLTGVLGLSGYFFMYKGFKKGSLSIISPISASWFVITTLVAAIVFSEALTLLHIFGVFVVFTGIFLVSTNVKEFKRSIEYGKSNGVLEAIISMTAWGFAFAFIKPIVDVSGPIIALLLVRVVASLTLFTWMKFSKISISIPSKALFITLSCAGLLDALGFAAYNLGIATEHISIVSPIAAAYPAVAILLARLLLKEKLAKAQKIGLAAILIGLATIALL
jgi:drug/metabolite transporter (DMT)-like permease